MSPPEIIRLAAELAPETLADGELASRVLGENGLISRVMSKDIIDSFASALKGSKIGQLTDGSIVQRFLDGEEVPFNVGKSNGLYARSIYFRTRPQNWLTLENPDGIERIYRGSIASELATGLRVNPLPPVAVPEWLFAKYPGVAEKGVPSWLRGDSAWLFGQANLDAPTRATFDHAGRLRGIEYAEPIDVSTGPFKGLRGTNLVATSDSAVLIDSTAQVGRRSQSYVYKYGSDRISTRVNGTGFHTKPLVLAPRDFGSSMFARLSGKQL